MDQLAPAIKWIKKNVFWLCCGFLSIAMIAMWFVASGVLATETKKNTTDVKTNVSTANSILTVKPDDIEEGGAHPNDVSENGMKQELSDTIDSIIEAWTIRKKAQDGILVWPKVIPNSQFVNFFGQYNPPETFPEKWNSGLQTQQMLELYRTKIPEQMAYLCGDDVLRTRWKYDPANLNQSPTSAGSSDEDEGDDEVDSGLGGFGGGVAAGLGAGRGAGGFGSAAGGMANAAAPIDWNKYAVRWSDKNQDLWWAKLTMFQGRDGNQFVDPTPLQCYMLQQDLWLLEAMFRIIREVNGDSNANDLSPIKTIDHVVFGREVGGKLGELTPPDQRLAGKARTESALGGGVDFGSDEDYGDEDYDDDEDDYSSILSGGGGGKMSGMSGAGMGGDGSVSLAAGSSVPYHNLYVDVNFEPLPADVVKQVITSQELPEENLELIVAKRIPVRIALRMDERRIGDFMAACANSPFAFEIQQIRWNRHTPGGDEIVLGGARSSGRSGQDKFSGLAKTLGGDAGGTSLTSEPIEVRTSYDVNVEFYGIVKIYNPVRADELRRAAGLTDENVDSGNSAGVVQSNANGDSTKP